MVMGATGQAITILHDSVVLDNDEIKALPTGDFTIVAAPGDGKSFLLFRARVAIDTTAGGYTNVDNNATLLFYDGDDASSYLIGDEFYTQEHQRTARFVAAAFLDIDSLSLISRNSDSANLTNQPLVLSCGNGANGAFTDGNAANTLTVDVWYAIIDG